MSDALYRRTQHACRICMGPVLAGEKEFICAVCDAASIVVSGICGCGIEVAGSRRGLGFRCAVNLERSPQSPAAVVILFGKIEE